MFPIAGKRGGRAKYMYYDTRIGERIRRLSLIILTVITVASVSGFYMIFVTILQINTELMNDGNNDDENVQVGRRYGDIFRKQNNHERRGSKNGASEAFATATCPGLRPEFPFMAYDTFLRTTVANPEYAYVTFITDSKFVREAAALMYSVAVSGSVYSRCILVTSNVKESDQEYLALFAQVILIDSIPSPFLQINNPQYRETFTKLRVWQLEPLYTKVLYLDTDMIVIRNMDDLFDLDMGTETSTNKKKGEDNNEERRATDPILASSSSSTSSSSHATTVVSGSARSGFVGSGGGGGAHHSAGWAVPLDGVRARYSTGMMLLRPSLATFDRMMVSLNEDLTLDMLELPDLLFLKEFFHNVWPYWKAFKALSSERGNKENGINDNESIGGGGGSSCGWDSSNNNDDNNEIGNGWPGSSGGGNMGAHNTSRGVDSTTNRPLMPAIRKRRVLLEFEKCALRAKGVVTVQSASVQLLSRWNQVYQFSAHYASYLTNRRQKLTIFDPRIRGIHYPGPNKPWNMAKMSGEENMAIEIAMRNSYDQTLVKSHNPLIGAVSSDPYNTIYRREFNLAGRQQLNSKNGNSRTSEQQEDGVTATSPSPAPHYTSSSSSMALSATVAEKGNEESQNEVDRGAEAFEARMQRYSIGFCSWYDYARYFSSSLSSRRYGAVDTRYHEERHRALYEKLRKESAEMMGKAKRVNFELKRKPRSIGIDRMESGRNTFSGAHNNTTAPLSERGKEGIGEEKFRDASYFEADASAHGEAKGGAEAGTTLRKILQHLPQTLGEESREVKHRSMSQQIHQHQQQQHIDIPLSSLPKRLQRVAYNLRNRKSANQYTYDDYSTTMISTSRTTNTYTGIADFLFSPQEARDRTRPFVFDASFLWFLNYKRMTNAVAKILAYRIKKGKKRREREREEHREKEIRSAGHPHHPTQQLVSTSIALDTDDALAFFQSSSRKSRFDNKTHTALILKEREEASKARSLEPSSLVVVGTPQQKERGVHVSGTGASSAYLSPTPPLFPISNNYSPAEVYLNDQDVLMHSEDEDEDIMPISSYRNNKIETQIKGGHIIEATSSSSTYGTNPPPPVAVGARAVVRAKRDAEPVYANTRTEYLSNLGIDWRKIMNRHFQPLRFYFGESVHYSEALVYRLRLTLSAAWGYGDGRSYNKTDKDDDDDDDENGTSSNNTTRHAGLRCSRTKLRRLSDGTYEAQCVGRSESDESVFRLTLFGDHLNDIINAWRKTEFGGGDG